MKYTGIILIAVMALASCNTLGPYNTPEIRRVTSTGSALGKCLQRTAKSFLVSNKNPQKVASMLDNACMSERKAALDAKRAAGLPVSYFDYGKGRHEVSLYWAHNAQWIQE